MIEWQARVANIESAEAVMCDSAADQQCVRSIIEDIVN